MKLVTLKNKRLAIVNDKHMMPFEFEGGMLGVIEAGKIGLGAARVRTATAEVYPIDLDAIATPLSNPSKVIAIGKNYADHAKETNSPIPKNPIAFTKFSTAIIGHGGAVTWRRDITDKVDYEGELAVIIGKTARQVSESEALDYVFGYSCANDVTARDIQASDGQWIRGKSLDTFCPIGPYIVTADEVPDPQALDIRCIINGQVMQSSNTQHMIFSIAYLISFLSQAFTLLPGDIILTGTPDGVGKFRNPPVFLQPGDKMVVEIEKVGRLVNHCAIET